MKQVVILNETFGQLLFQTPYYLSILSKFLKYPFYFLWFITLTTFVLLFNAPLTLAPLSTYYITCHHLKIHTWTCIRPCCMFFPKCFILYTTLFVKENKLWIQSPPKKKTKKIEIIQSRNETILCTFHFKMNF